MKAIYLNNFRIAFPVAFSTARRPTRLPPDYPVPIRLPVYHHISVPVTAADPGTRQEVTRRQEETWA